MATKEEKKALKAAADTETEEEIDSVITHWQELPELPEEVSV